MEMTEQRSEYETHRISDDLSAVSFEKLLELKNKLGTKVYNEAVFVDESDASDRRQTTTKRVNKNRPREMSSKRPVPSLGSTGTSRHASIGLARDPRFDDRCGVFDKSIFKANYEFVNSIQQKEIRKLESMARKTAEVEQKELLRLASQRLKNKCLEEKRRKERMAKLKEEMRETKRARDEGKQKWHKSKSEQRLDELVQQYEKLKKSGKLEKHIEKRRKKNLAKDRKKLGTR